MAKNQKYYYMRLRADFFSRKDIILLESMPNGAVYCLILLKLLTASLENNGHLMLNEEIVMTPTMLATITNFSFGDILFPSDFSKFQHLIGSSYSMKGTRIKQVPFI